MARGAKTRQPITANTRQGKIKAFVPKQVEFSEEDGFLTATFRPLSYRQLSTVLSTQFEGIIRDFPVIFHADGTPWDLGNLYLQKCFYSLVQGRPIEIATIQNKAKALTLYLRWIETLQEKRDAINVLDFSGEKHTRPTYRYYLYLRNQLRQIPQTLALNTVKERMSQVIQFYRGCLQWNLVQEGAIENAPFEEKVVGIHYVNSVGLGAIKQSVTTDISFTGNRRKPQQPANDSILDGSRLVPLNLMEKTDFLKALAKYGNRTFELICHTSLWTGARLQTVCTLRISDIQKLDKMKPDKNGEKWLLVGQGCLTDLKGEEAYTKRQQLHLPQALITTLLEYIDSEFATQRREKSFYGDIDENYVFLNQNGGSFYTSRQEMKDRVNPNYSQRIVLSDRVDFTIAKGQAVENITCRLRAQIAIDYPEYRDVRFHDLRATFGMDFIRNWIESGKNPNTGIGQLQARMGHSSPVVTLQYLNWLNEIDIITPLEDAHYDTLKGEVK